MVSGIAWLVKTGASSLRRAPVFDENGKRVSSYTSIWRLEAPGT